MITNLRPRILNKESSPSVIKGTDMLDAVNIVADGLETSEQNTVKKIPGTIDVFFNDSDDAFLNTVLGVSVNKTAVVLGHCVDKERNRVFYFTSEYTAGSDTQSNGKIYMMEQFAPDEIKIVILGLISDILPEDFVAANIIRVPVLEEEYNLDENFGGVQEDQDTIIEFDDSVDVTDIQGEITVISTPNFPNLVVNPLEEAPSTTGFLTIQNTGGAIAYQTLFEFGEGINAEDPQDHSRIEMSIGQEALSELAPGDTFNLPITITTEGGVEAGTYEFFVTVISQNYTQVIPVQFALNIEVKTLVDPKFSISIQTSGPSSADYTYGENVTPSISLGPIEENSGIDSEATITFVREVTPDDEVSLPLGISFEIDTAQEALELSIGESDIAGSEVIMGGFEAILTDENTVAQFKIKLRDNNGPFENVVYDRTIQFSTSANLIAYPGFNSDGFSYEDIDVQIAVSVLEEVIVLPADIGTTGFNNQQFGLLPHLTNEENESELGVDAETLDGSSVTVTVGTIYNNGDEDGHFFLNLRGSTQGYGLEQLASLNKVGLRYKIGNVNSGDWKQMFSMTSIFNAVSGLDDGFPPGSDISLFSETLAGGNSQQLHIRIENIDDTCRAGVLDTIGETYEGDVILFENSWIGALGVLEMLRVEVHQIPSPDTNLTDVGSETYNNSGSTNPSVKGFMDIETIISTAEPIIGPTIVESRGRQTTAQLDSTGGGPLGGGLTTYYPKQFASIFTDPNQQLLDSIQANDGSVYSGSTDDGDGVGFAVANTSVAASGAADPTITISVSVTFQEPNFLGPFGSGFENHDPNPFQGTFGAVGSLGPVLVYTEPYLIGSQELTDFDSKDLSSYPFSAYNSSLAYGNNGDGHAEFGSCRQFFTTIPSSSVVFFAVKPEFSSYITFLQTPSSEYSYAFEDDHYGSFCGVNVNVNGNSTTLGNNTNRVVFPLTNEQWDWVHSQPDFGGAPPTPSRFDVDPTPSPLPFNDESIQQVVARPSFRDSSEVGSLTSRPKKIVKKSASSNKTKKRGYGK